MTPAEVLREYDRGQPYPTRTALAAALRETLINYRDAVKALEHVAADGKVILQDLALVERIEGENHELRAKLDKAYIEIAWLKAVLEDCPNHTQTEG